MLRTREPSRSQGVPKGLNIVASSAGSDSDSSVDSASVGARE